jgi:hypothetical protein
VRIRACALEGDAFLFSGPQFEFRRFFLLYFSISCNRDIAELSMLAFIYRKAVRMEWASDEGRAECVRVLVEAGADTELKTNVRDLRLVYSFQKCACGNAAAAAAALALSAVVVNLAGSFATARTNVLAWSIMALAAMAVAGVQCFAAAGRPVGGTAASRQHPALGLGATAVASLLGRQTRAPP